MSIGVQSFPELYTTLLGWELYDKLWMLLTETGIAFLPFLGIILSNFSSSYIKYSSEQAAGGALRSMEVNLIVTLLIIFFAATPCLSLDARAISYSPICQSDSDKTAFHPGDTGTTYDKAFTVPTGNITVPIWWYVVISVSQGITHAANTMVGCTPNLRKMVTEVNMAHLTDPELKQEMQDFNTMCFIPARTQFFQDQRTNNQSVLQKIDQDVKKHGEEDTEWAGSHSFSNVYYKNLKASRPITGFPYIQDQDINSDVKGQATPQYGAPDCNSWWNNEDHGLKSRLYKVVPKTFADDFKDLIKDEKVKDNLVKNIVSNANGYDNANSTLSDTGYSRVGAAVGIWYHQLEEYPKLYAAQQAAPIIQALILLMIYVFLPFGLVFSSYRASSLITSSIVVFSVIFWSFVWRLVEFTDKSLMQALYTSWFERQGPGATLADMIIASLIIFAPIFWFLFMGAMGIAAGNVVGAFTGLNKIGENAGRSGGQLAQTGVKAAGAAL